MSILNGDSSAMKRMFKWIGIVFGSLLLSTILVLGIAYYHKAEILAAVNNELKKNVNGDIHIADIDFTLLEDFPAFSITLKDIYIRPSNYRIYKTDFLHAEKLSLDVRITSFLQKKIVIRSVKIVAGEIFAFRSRTGATNLDIFKKKEQRDTTSRNPASITVNKIILQGVAVSYHDSLKEKSFGIDFLHASATIVQTDSSNHWTLSGPVRFRELTFNKRNGSFLHEKTSDIALTFDYAPRTRRLSVERSLLRFDHSSVFLEGRFVIDDPGSFALMIQSDNLNYTEGNSLLTSAIQSKLAKFGFDKPISITTTLAGNLAGGSQPDVDVQFRFTESHVTVPGVNIVNATGKASYTNHVNNTLAKNDENSRITIHSFRGVIEDLPTQLTATFDNLSDPEINLNSTISLALPTANAKLDTTQFKLLEGTFKSEVRYVGKLSEYLDSDKTKFAGKLNGEVTIKNGAFEYRPRKQHFEKINAQIRFTQDSLIVSNVSLVLNKNPVFIKGQVLGFIPFFHQPEEKGNIKLLITSPSFDLTSFLTRGASRKLTRKQKSDKKKSISEMLEKLYSRVECDLTIQADNLSCNNFKGKDVRGRLMLTNNSLRGVNMKMKLAKGDMNFTFTLNNLQKEIKKLSVIGSVNHANIRQFFYAFSDFNQNAISHKNLEGNVRMDVKFNTDVTNDYSVKTSSMTGDIHLVITDGKLDHYEPLQKMNNFLFKNRDFDVVQFGEIATHLTLAGSDINIERMEIESSLLRMFLEGRYSFSDSTDLSVQLPLSNLKKRDKTYQPKNIGVDAKAGPSIFLHVYKDATGKTVFAYDPFKRHVKKLASNFK